MSINKAFVVRNGFEVSTDLILANANTRKVGIASTNPQYTLDVAGGIGATDFYLTGIGTFVDELNVGLGGTVLTVLGIGNSIGIGTALPQYLLDIRSPVSTGQTALYVQGDVRITGDLEVSNVDTVDLNVTGIATIATISVVGAALSSLIVSGITTLGTVQISSGIVTATSGIVTYYGDGQYLDLSANPSTGIGIGTTGGVVGYGITFIDFYGAGVSTTFYDSNVGIATIFFEGGGGGGGGGLFVSKFGDNMFAGLGVTVGSLSSPSVYFNGYTNSGFYSPADNEFGIVVSGTQRLNVNSSGINVTGVATATSVIVGSAVTINSSGINVTGITTIKNASGTVTIGIGTTALLVEGNARVTGILTVGSASITLDGTNNRINVGTGLTLSSSGINVTGVITATSFVGSGSGLTGVGIGSSGSINTSGIITATSFVGNLTGSVTGTASTATAAATAYGLTGSPNITVGIATASGGVVLSNSNITTIKTASFNSQNTIATTSGSITVDWNVAQNQKQNEPTGTITYTFTAPPGPCHLQLLIDSDGTSTAQTINWPGTVIYLGSTWSGANNKRAVINFWYDGTNYFAIGTNQA